MKRYTSFLLILHFAILAVILGSCEKFFDPEQNLVVKKEDFFKDWSEYRAAEMGLYALQQDLVDQLVILGELRGDLVEITPGADRDLIDVYNFQITNENKFASPINFYKLIAACNSLINKVESEHPEVLMPEENINNYDRLYGEAKCMRAWAYFNAVRIYREVPYIWPSLTSVSEIKSYVNSTEEFVDSVDIRFHPGGYYNDTTYNQPVTLERIFVNLDQVIDTFAMELERDIKAVGIIHNKDNFDPTWNVTVWTWHAYKCLLGQMYLYQGDYVNAEFHFRPILYNDDSETSDIKYGLDDKFSFGRWRNIFAGLDNDEHIFTLWFGKSFQQQHNLQRYFDIEPPNQYMLKPTRMAVHNWETMWEGMVYSSSISDPEDMEMSKYGIPGDLHRGFGVSYAYRKDGRIMEASDIREMLLDKQAGLWKEVENLMEGVDTLVYKYTYGKQPYDQDANFIIYRAASIHLYYAEIFCRWEWDHSEAGDGGLVKPEPNKALSIVNNGSYSTRSAQMGVRGRVGFGGEVIGNNQQDDDIKAVNVIYRHDPFTNEVIGYKEYPTLLDKQLYLEDQLMQERARELAFEGERFYDLVRIAKRRNDPSYLADKVAAKFSGAKREQIRAHLMNEDNWYIPFYE